MATKPSRMPDRQPLTDNEICALIDEWEHQGINEDIDEISNRRQTAYDRYLMEKQGDEQEGRSSAITPEVMETVEWAIPSLVRTFLHGEPAKFRAMGADDMDAAEYETKLVNWIIRQQNDVYSEMCQWFREALLYPNAYLKVFYEKVENKDFREYTGMTEEQVMGLSMQEPNAEIRDLEQSEDGLSFVLMTNEKVTRVCLEAVPPEEVIVASNHTTLNLDDADYVIHKTSQVTRSDLIAMGYDYDTVMSLDHRDEDLSDQEKTARRDTVDENDGLSELPTEEMLQTVDYVECYGKIDADGDGYTERRKICKAGDVILENKYDSYQPFCALTCLIQPHRHVGYGIAESAVQTQRQNTVIKRQMLDNLYRTNGPRGISREVDEDSFNNYQPHALIKGDPSKLGWETIPPIIDQNIAFLQYQGEEMARATGISRHAMGLDADTLANSTMGAYLEAAGHSSQRMELVVRTFAETGIAQMMCKVHELMRRYQNQPIEAEVNGQWVASDPQQWRKRTQVVPTVGIGHGSHRERAAAAMQVLEIQREVLEMGGTTPDRIYQSMKLLCNALGLHDAEAYFVDPSSQEGQQIAQSMADSAQQEQAAQMAMMQEQMAAIQGQVQAQLQRAQNEFIKIHREDQRKLDDLQQKFIDMELKYAVDIANVGTTSADVVPMSKGQTDAG